MSIIELLESHINEMKLLHFQSSEEHDRSQKSEAVKRRKLKSAQPAKMAEYHIGFEVGLTHGIHRAEILLGRLKGEAANGNH